jgi:[ribosomal protein S18]-alanine N-acetyltransferase
MSAALEATLPRLRPMREADVERVLDIERVAYDFPWSEDIFRDCLRVGYSCWVLERFARIEAYCILQMAAGEAHVLNLCVDPQVHRQGLGRFLLERMIELSRDRHAEAVLLEVRPSNRPARRLYRSLGFTEVGTRRGYYPDLSGREDAIVLGLALR